MLRACGERPCSSAGEQRDELAPSDVTCHAPLPRRHAQSNNITPLFRSFTSVARRPQYGRLTFRFLSISPVCPRLYADVTPLKKRLTVAFSPSPAPAAY